MTRLFLLVSLVLVAAGCSDSKQSTAESNAQAENKHIMSAQLETLEKAKGVEQLILDSDKNRRLKMDE